MSMLDELCEQAKRQTKAMPDGELGSWKRAVTCADGTWQTRGWHSTFSIRNYLRNACGGSSKICAPPALINSTAACRRTFHGWD